MKVKFMFNSTVVVNVPEDRFDDSYDYGDIVNEILGYEVAENCGLVPFSNTRVEIEEDGNVVYSDDLGDLGPEDELIIDAE